MDWQQFVRELDKLGYFRYLGPKGKSHALHRLKTAKKPGAFFTVTAKRYCYANPQRLIECGVATFLREINLILSANNVVITDVKEDCSRTGYSIEINGTEHLIYSYEELNSPNREYWQLTKQRTFAIVNSLLKEAGSDERIFNTLNDTEEWAFFLTVELYDFLVKNGFIEVGKEFFLYE